jgi:hypothetical protein
MPRQPRSLVLLVLSRALIAKKDREMSLFFQV